MTIRACRHCGTTEDLIPRPRKVTSSVCHECHMKQLLGVLVPEPTRYEAKPEPEPKPEPQVERYPRLPRIDARAVVKIRRRRNCSFYEAIRLFEIEKMGVA